MSKMIVINNRGKKPTSPTQASECCSPASVYTIEGGKEQGEINERGKRASNRETTRTSKKRQKTAYRHARNDTSLGKKKSSFCPTTSASPPPISFYFFLLLFP